MNCHSSRLLLIPLVCALMAQHCCSFPEPQLKRTLEQLALPRVTCYVRRIKAVFGPMVKSNIHVKGKNVFTSSNATSTAETSGHYQSKVIVWPLCVYSKHLHRAQPYHVLFCCSFLVPSDITGATIPVPHSKESCGVRLTRDKNRNLSFFSRYDSCYAQIEVK